MWAGVCPRTWQNYESGRVRLPKNLRLRLNELRYQDRVFAHVREQLLALLPSLRPQAERDRVGALLSLLESATPDSERLRTRRRSRELPNELVEALASALDAHLRAPGASADIAT
jgi:hypothetical protein